MSTSRTTPGRFPFFAVAAAIGGITFACMFSSGCNRPDARLAVYKMSAEQLAAAPYLCLNADSPGTWVNPQRFLVRGKYTVVEYFSPYSPSYAALEPRLQQLAQGRNDLVVRTINVNRADVQGIDWQSSIVQDVGIRSLPHFAIYDPSLMLRANGRPAMEQIQMWVGMRIQ